MRETSVKLPRLIVLGLVLLLGFSLIPSPEAAGDNSIPPQSSELLKKVPQLLEFPFEYDEPIGSAKNPAVLLPATTGAIIGNLPVARRVSDYFVVPIAELQRITNQPLVPPFLSTVLSQVTSAKSFDGFSAVDGTSVGPSYDSLVSIPNSAARRIGKEDSEKTRSLLRNGDLVFGSHVFNWMTWGRYIHVGIVSDATRGKLLEATANGPSDRPGVQETDWKNYADLYGHIGVVRVKNLSPEQITNVIRWVEAKKGRPYRWPLIMGVDNNDESRFYCSQLVWLAFKKVVKIDLDADQGALVFPDDIYNSWQHLEVIVR